ncbi:hypothetical protein A500_06356 [Clostridium sartagoforme AAU1]|uniref:Uncharacterized protein n=1 Tax=Clostridium sartagoforme AAU1 TaxID=1202534 RepID=R9CCG2_9CLOT|nr:hypothetical protein A500_06356 [Clostridium sartagoforme AAU1]
MSEIIFSAFPKFFLGPCPIGTFLTECRIGPAPIPAPCPHVRLHFMHQFSNISRANLFCSPS